jgi:hypothetical protein
LITELFYFEIYDLRVGKNIKIFYTDRMSGLQLFFLNLDQNLTEAEFVAWEGRGAIVLWDQKRKFIPKSCILWIPELPEQDYDKVKPRYAYKSEEFMVLWDNDRYVEDNLRDMFRYYQRNTDGVFLEEYWRLILGEVAQEITHEEMTTAWLMAKRMEADISPIENNMAPYIPGEQVSFNWNGVQVDFTTHAIERTFERSNVRRENFRSLVWQMLQDSIPVKTKKQDAKPGSVFLYNNDFNWTFALVPKSEARDAYVVVTCFEPSIHWRKKDVDWTTPFLESEEV